MVNVIYPLKAITHAYWPSERAHFDIEFGLELIEQIESLFTIAVHFVDKDNHGCIAHATNLHQAFCLSFYPIGAVNDKNDAIDSSKRSKGIFGKIFVTRCI